MKQIISIIPAALSALLLTACGASGSSLPQTTEPAASLESTTSETTTEQTSAATELTTGQSAELTTDPALTTLSETTLISTTTAVQSNRNDWLDSIGTLLDGSYVAKLRCTGTVCAHSGVNLRKAPGTSSDTLKKLKFGTALEITGITAAGSVTDYEGRWLRVKAGGQEGYVCSEYVNASCSIPLAQLSGEEIGALGILMYYQGQRLGMYFEREGGYFATDKTEEYSGEYCRLKPDGLTLAQLRTEMHRWFGKDYQDKLDQYYIEKDGALWVMTGYGDNVALEYSIPEKLSGRTDNALSYDIRAQWYPDFDMTQDGSNQTAYKFMLKFEDGAWKIAAIEMLY
ncbi:MAG: SH3 domain-containing protein [Oscillospiraceae bacterium]|nr:SH3 domain-containing protein [Oscillospiraceae bacterium]MCR5306332.1 SH3 domain-containing protein [Oscillospiraceae bacterium]